MISNINLLTDYDPNMTTPLEGVIVRLYKIVWSDEYVVLGCNVDDVAHAAKLKPRLDKRGQSYIIVYPDDLPAVIAAVRAVKPIAIELPDSEDYQWKVYDNAKSIHPEYKAGRR